MSDDATRSRAATPTPHCTKFGCEFFTAYGEPTERCIRCGSTPHATPDRVQPHAKAPRWEQEYRDWLVEKYGHSYDTLDSALEDGKQAVEFFRDHVGHG